VTRRWTVTEFTPERLVLGHCPGCYPMNDQMKELETSGVGQIAVRFTSAFCGTCPPATRGGEHYAPFISYAHTSPPAGKGA
jgi:hypothetical protein